MRRPGKHAHYTCSKLTAIKLKLRERERYFQLKVYYRTKIVFYFNFMDLRCFDFYMSQLDFSHLKTISVQFVSVCV